MCIVGSAHPQTSILIRYCLPPPGAKLIETDPPASALYWSSLRPLSLLHNNGERQPQPGHEEEISHCHGEGSLALERSRGRPPTKPGLNPTLSYNVSLPYIQVPAPYSTKVRIDFDSSRLSRLEKSNLIAGQKQTWHKTHRRQSSPDIPRVFRSCPLSEPRAQEKFFSCVGGFHGL